MSNDPITAPAGDVAVVVPCYNSEEYVALTINSALRQPEVGEIVVVDDGSSDGSLGVLERLAAASDRIRVVTKENGGIASARNLGGQMVSAGSKYVVFLDNDDVLADGAVRVLRDRLEARPECPAAHGIVDLIDEHGGVSAERNWEVEDGRLAVAESGALLPSRIARLPDSADTTLAAIALRNPIATPGQALIRRDAYERTEGFDADAKYCEDWDLWMSLARFGTFDFVRQPMLEYRRHPGGASRAMGRIRLTDKYVRRKWMSQPGLSEAYRRTVRRAWIAYEIDRAKERVEMSFAALRRGKPKESLQELLRSASSLKELLVACVFARRTPS